MQTVSDSLFDLKTFIPANLCSHRSTTSNSLEITQYLHRNLIDGNRVDVVCFDFSKAFDRIDHELLASKLAIFIVQNVDEFYHRQNIRAQDGRCNLRKHLYNYQIGESGLSLWFLAMCRDIAKCVNNTDVRMLQYPDDTKLSQIGKNDEDRQCIRRKLSTIYQDGLKQTGWNRTVLRQYYVSIERIAKITEIRDSETDVLVSNKLYGAGYRFIKDLRSPQLILKIIKVYKYYFGCWWLFLHMGPRQGLLRTSFGTRFT